jgi:hypothetical protein
LEFFHGFLTCLSSDYVVALLLEDAGENVKDGLVIIDYEDVFLLSFHLARLLVWKCYCERRAFSGFAREADIAALRLDQFLAHC